MVLTLSSNILLYMYFSRTCSIAKTHILKAFHNVDLLHYEIFYNFSN
jgi:hypothetical protein